MGRTMPKCTGNWQVGVQSPALPLSLAAAAVRQGHATLAPWADERSKVWVQALCRARLSLQAPALAHWAQPEVFRYACYSSHTDHDLWGSFSKTLASPPPPAKVRNEGWYEWNRGGRKANMGIPEQVTPGDNCSSILLGPGGAV